MNKKYMRLAFQEAKKYRFCTYTNPLVGCCIVKDNQILALSGHQLYGDKHAEINALNQIKDKSILKDASMYITLEPCCHFGKQPPCVNKIKQFPFKKIYIGQLDPNPIVSGKGMRVLQNSRVRSGK